MRGIITTLVTGLVLVACGTAGRSAFNEGTNGEQDPNLPAPGAGGGLGGGESGPTACDAAKNSKSYVGCDYWPTVTANAVWSIFDFAVVVANTGDKEAEIHVTGPNGVDKTVTVPSGELKKIYLPWVKSLKGGDADECGAPPASNGSVYAAGGAYHLVSSLPVVVYQFNALEYKGAGGEEPNGDPKDWSSCPGTAKTCFMNLGPIGCFSFSNDASLLLPSTAMTGNYRIIGQHGFSGAGAFGARQAINGSYVTITATQPDTEVTIALASNANVLAGGQAIAARKGGETLKITLAKAGDVAQVMGEKGEQFDLSGSLVQATKPVQVIAGNPCINLPSDKAACDHIEETVAPAETLGKSYLVHPPTGAKGTAAAANVRLYGNKDGTKLTYKPSKPENCPDTLEAGQVGDCGIVSEAFEVTGDNEFAVATFLLGATYYGEGLTADRRGDPSASTFAGTEQFRTDYLFLAPDDYSVSYLDITAPENAGVELDGSKVSASFAKVEGSSFGVYRVKLGAGKGGVHKLTSKLPVGVQIVGYGDNTSYQVPAGLNLNLIAAPPPK